MVTLSEANYFSLSLSISFKKNQIHQKALTFSNHSHRFITSSTSLTRNHSLSKISHKHDNRSIIGEEKVEDQKNRNRSREHWIHKRERDSARTYRNFIFILILTMVGLGFFHHFSSNWLHTCSLKGRVSNPQPFGLWFHGIRI